VRLLFDGRLWSLGSFIGGDLTRLAAARVSSLWILVSPLLRSRRTASHIIANSFDLIRYSGLDIFPF
jgi:hypothetical protein